MIKYLIVEDERLSYQELKRMMNHLRPDYIFAERTESITATLNFLKNNKVDLILLDIRLVDGDCFEIFNHMDISTPIIFTTAYDEHAIRAFKHNSIDYLLKPIEEEALAVALNKFEQLYQSRNNLIDYKILEGIIPQQVKKRFLIQKGDLYSYVESEDIAFFYSEEKVVFAHTFADKRYIINYTLDQLEKRLDTKSFFRVSRNCIANIRSIKNISKYFNNRLKLFLTPECPHEILVSRMRVNDFLQWVDDAS